MNYSRNNVINTDVEIIENETEQYSFKEFEDQDPSGEIWSTDYPVLVPEIQWNPQLLDEPMQTQSDKPIALPFRDHFRLLERPKTPGPPAAEDPNRIDRAGDIEQSPRTLAAEARPRVENNVDDDDDSTENTDPKGKPRRKTKNPFIAFFLSMYSRRPRRRVADVARQAARQWSRMTDWRKRRIALRAGIENWKSEHSESSNRRRKPKSCSS
ncbi:hypothetical protein TKK_0018530 [Trichogramma kaykai]